MSTSRIYRYAALLEFASRYKVFYRHKVITEYICHFKRKDTRIYNLLGKYGHTHTGVLAVEIELIYIIFNPEKNEILRTLLFEGGNRKKITIGKHAPKRFYLGCQKQIFAAGRIPYKISHKYPMRT